MNSGYNVLASRRPPLSYKSLSQKNILWVWAHWEEQARRLYGMATYFRESEKAIINAKSSMSTNSIITNHPKTKASKNTGLLLSVSTPTQYGNIRKTATRAKKRQMRLIMFDPSSFISSDEPTSWLCQYYLPAYHNEDFCQYWRNRRIIVENLGECARHISAAISLLLFIAQRFHAPLDLS